MGVFPTMTAYAAAYIDLIGDKSSFLHASGWMETMKRGYPCRGDGSVLPWMNYPVITFLEQRLKKDFSVFEYGSGYSTLFYARFVKNVTSVEHNESWYNKLKNDLPDNAKLILKAKDCDGDYCRSINMSDELYDIVTVDGRDRVNCIKQSIEKLSDRGVMLLDDSLRERYSEGILHARNRGFIALDFEGLKPAGSKIDRTTIFYRRGNCLDI